MVVYLLDWSLLQVVFSMKFIAVIFNQSKHLAYFLKLYSLINDKI